MFQVMVTGKMYSPLLWDGRIEPVAERLWHQCPICNGAVATPHELMKRGQIMVHTDCFEAGSQEKVIQ